MAKQMVTSDAKEQFYSPSKAVLDLWERTHQGYKGAVGKRAKDLGVTQRGLNVSSGIRKKGVDDMRRKATRLKSLKSGKRSKITVTRVSLHASAL